MTDAVYETLRTDSDLGPIVEDHGRLSLDPAEDLFQRLVTSIVRQQVSMASAEAIRDRLFDTVEVTPSGILATDPETLRDVGLSQQKTRYLQDAARTFQAEGYDRETLARLSNDAVRDRLIDITGVGDWTVDMQLMFALGREDVFPVGDLGIRTGMHAIVDPDLTCEEMVAHAERWRPYRSYAALYLWRVTDD
ncbi:MAG: DNA-3-methyladenine glycosylase [Halobacteriaceae archaeon]